MKSYYQYPRDVLDGRIVAGEFIKLAAERFFAFLDDDRYEFREDRVDRVIDFVSILTHYTGRHAGKPFLLEPWQAFIVANLYGFYVKADGSRLTQFAYIEVSRKNGKTALAAALALCGLIADGEAAPEVYLAANSKDQVRLSAWPLCSNFARGIDPDGADLEIYRDMVRFDAVKGWLKVLAADSTKLDGPNPSTFLLDEYHAAKNSSLKDVLQSGQGMRDNPLGIITTTAGFDKLGPCYQFRTMCTEVLKGLKVDDTLFSAIYSLDENDDWKDGSNWIKSNPNLDVTVKKSYVRRNVQMAANNPSEEVGVKTKNLNLWCDASNVWIPEHYILNSSQNLSLDDFKGEDCYVGIDLSSTSDLTSTTYLFPRSDAMYFFIKYYLPEVALTEKRFKELYGSWRVQGLITITPGNVTDYDFILEDLMRLDSQAAIQVIGYDSWNATQFTINATDRGLPMAPVQQSLGAFNRPTKEMERLILSGKARFNNNAINRHCFRNVVLKHDHNGNIKPTKQFAEKKIDGVISGITALGAYLDSPRYSPLL